MPLHELLGSSADIVHCIGRHVDGIRPLAYFSTACKTFHQALNRTTTGHQLWLDQAIKATFTSKEENGDDFSAKALRAHFERVPPLMMLHHVRLLVCPWLSEQEHMQDVDFNRGLRDVKQRLFFSKSDRGRLCYRHPGSETQTSFPARPCDDFESQIRYEDPLDDVPRRPLKALRRRAKAKEIVPDFFHDRRTNYSLFPVHGGAYAVVEMDSNMTGDIDDEFLFQGVYFFSCRNGLMLRHILLPDLSFNISADLLSRPTELWVLGCSGVQYFGPRSSLRPNFASEYIDPALWMAGRGDITGAVTFMRTLGFPLDTRGLIASRTLLHYAALSGRKDAVSELLKQKGQDVNAEDAHGLTPLFYAAAELHADAVEELVTEGKADVFTVERGSCLQHVGYNKDERKDAVTDEQAELEVREIVPRIVRTLVGATLSAVVGSDEDMNEVRCGFLDRASLLSCPEAVRCVLGSELLVRPMLADIVPGFREFRSPVFETHALDTLVMLVTEKKLDINARSSDEDAPILTMVQFAPSEAVVLAIDRLGADPTVRSKVGKSLRDLADYRRRSQPNDTHAMRIIAFLDARLSE